jgi:hypothetical protein
MNDAVSRKCKKKGCNNPVLDGNYCEHCKQSRKEQRENFLKGAGGVLMILIAVILKKKPK